MIVSITQVDTEVIFSCSNTVWHHFSLEPLTFSEEKRALKETSRIKNPGIRRVLQIKSWAGNTGSLRSHPLFDLNPEFSLCCWNFINNCLLIPVGNFCLLVIFAVFVAPGCKRAPEIPVNWGQSPQRKTSQVLRVVAFTIPTYFATKSSIILSCHVWKHTLNAGTQHDVRLPLIKGSTGTSQPSETSSTAKRRDTLARKT